MPKSFLLAEPGHVERAPVLDRAAGFVEVPSGFLHDVFLPGTLLDGSGKGKSDLLGFVPAKLEHRLQRELEFLTGHTA
jgi:hypothetical protein